MLNANVALWTNNGILPRFEIGRDRMEEVNGIANEGYLEKAQFCEDSYSYQHVTASDPNADFGVPSLDEIERMNSVITDLETYSSELLTKLILGQKSLDDFDSYISDLQRLGLDTIIEINQARYDRAHK